MFDPHLPVNSEMPPKVPLKPQGNRPVIARMVWLDGEEFTPGRAIRWTPTHVMVSWLADPADPRTERSCWFRADDVSTHLPKRRKAPTP